MVNPQKSAILFSKDAAQANDICEILNVNISATPIKYLGLPIFYKKLKFQDFQPLIHKISSSLDGWKAKLLSFARRIQLLKFTISNTLAYWIHGSIIPKGCCKIINRMCPRFLYFGSINSRKLHTIAWKDTCVPKSKGGLGIPSIEALYHNFACSTIWRFLNSTNILFDWWNCKLHSLWKPLNANSSQYWKHLCVIAGNIKHCLSLFIHADSKLSFIWDPWCNGSSIADLMDSSQNASLYSSFADWNVGKIIIGNRWLCLTVLRRILFTTSTSTIKLKATFG
ncbi:Putative ribonuclease H protein [Dendrobium catenatum]|uniref:Ribonuclease H protein n=1 Tax=Dendrobium catenatum TaxID=906689 RepID=A0A2I0VXJ7_9ASPA|nr:Putative ribonuclease H protein [Dendrobium catenatum]